MVKIIEQYTTKLNPEEHQKMLEAVKWLNENGFLQKTNKYEVTKYALQTLIGIVDNKKKKLEEDLKLAKELHAKQDVIQNAKDDITSDVKEDAKQDTTQEVVS